MPASINIFLSLGVSRSFERTGKDTFGCLNQYFKALSNIPSPVKQLSAAMDTLVTREKDIKAVQVSSTMSHIFELIKPISAILGERQTPLF